MTLQELYDYIIDNYRTRICFIYDLAVSLGITYKEANHLTYVLGYRRGRAKVLNTFASFSKDAEVRRIQALIP